MQKLLTFFLQKKFSVYAIFHDQNDIVSFEQLSSDIDVEC